MKKKGFTLIELLAVIVVLAIIALIATPIVMNVISNASKGAAERSADNYVKAVETLIATKRLDGEPVEDGTYTIGTDGNLSFGDVELNGTKPSGGSIKIENGQVVKENTSIKVGDYTVTFKDGVASIKELAKLLDVCDYLEEDAHNESRDPNTVGAKYSCNLGSGARNFYVLESGTSSKPATLILEENYDTTTQSWCASGDDNSCQADGLTAKLDEIAGTWTKLDRSQIGLPSMEQIMIADGKAADAYLEYPEISNKWVYESLSVAGYWTSTPDPYLSDGAFLVSRAQVSAAGVGVDKYHGVRPVIILSI
ncbi:MAG: type II secretion system protein [Firmicutes bacterium]|nr:type II secretion system protein [Bacillota bacterium]